MLTSHSILQYQTCGYKSLHSGFQRMRVDTNILTDYNFSQAEFLSRLDILEQDVKDWLSRNEWNKNDSEEYPDSRLENLRRVLLAVRKRNI